VHADAIFQRERSERCANELLLARFRAEDIRVLRRGYLRFLTAPATKAPSWCCGAGFSTAERYAELDHCGPSGLSRHSPSRRRSVNLALVQTEKIFRRLSCWHLAHPSASLKHTLVGGTITLRVFVPEPSTFVCMASSARSSPRRPCTLLRTEPPPHRRPLLPSSPKPTGARYHGAAFSIPRCAPIESAQSDESWSCRRANPFRFSASLVVGINATRVPTQFIESAWR